MNAPLIVAVPAKGRLQENAEAFFARAGLTLMKPRGARDYRGAIAGLDGVEVAYLSTAEITSQLAVGGVHLGVTGEDLVREMIPDADKRVVLIEGLGFGFANVVVAVPQAWIDVRTMALPKPGLRVTSGPAAPLAPRSRFLMEVRGRPLMP